jgi:uroporphyrinogen-III decarboxylase
MLSYFNAFGPHVEKLRTESGTVSAIAGIFKAPFDIIGDKLRGYMGLTMDMMTQPEKVLKACEALMPHLYNVALTSSDANKQVPIGYWMHRGCIPFVSAGQFESHYWPTVRPIIEELWKNGHQTLFYAEGSWDYHLESFAELPEKSIVYHVDTGDIFKTHRTLGHKFCLSGGIPNTLLSFGTPDEIRARCKKVIDEVARDGGYMMDASAIIQNDATVENMRVLTDFTREYGVYADGHLIPAEPGAQVAPGTDFAPGPGYGMGSRINRANKAGLCIPYEEKRLEIPSVNGDEQLVKQIWEDVDSLGNMFIWQCLLSF